MNRSRTDAGETEFNYDRLPTSLQQPLLHDAPSLQEEQDIILPITEIIDAGQAQQLSPRHPGVGVNASAVILSKTILGAGATALPFAFRHLGVVYSISFLLLTALVTHFSIQALAVATLVTRDFSYPGVTTKLLGHTAGIVLEVSLILRCAGLMVVYLVIAADILSGTDRLPGALCDILSALGLSPASSDWCTSRALSSLIVTLIILVPLVTPKNLSSSTITSYVGLFAVVVWSITTLVLAGLSCWHSKDNCLVNSLTLWPKHSNSTTESTLHYTIKLLAVLPILATAYTNQMTVHFIMKDLSGFSSRLMSRVSATAMTICTILFLAVGIGSLLAFTIIPSDILKAFDTESLASLDYLSSHTAALYIGLTVRLGFLMSVLFNFPMQMLPFRESTIRLLFSGRNVETLHGNMPYYILTYGSLAGIYIVALLSGNIWKPLQLVGATAGAVIAFFIPAAVALAVNTVHQVDGGLYDFKSWYLKLGGWLLIVLGVIQAVTGVTAALFME